MEDIRAIAGPIVQRYFDKVEEERAAVQARLDAEIAAKKAAEDAAKKAANGDSKDEEMTDAEAIKPDEIVEADGKNEKK
jgi:heat shock 70kDa protein 4